MPCSAAELVDGDCLLGSVDFVDFPELGAYFACSRRLSRHAAAAWDARSWRMQSLEARIPEHVKWRPAADPELNQLQRPGSLQGSRRACATWRLARGLQLYEQKRFKDAEDELRALLVILPGRPFAMCRLADTLYGRAVSLNAAVPSQPTSRSSTTPASAGEAWVDERMDHDQGAGDGDEAGEGEGDEGEPPMPYSRSPLSPAPPRLEGQASMQSLSVSESSIAAPEPQTSALTATAAVARWQEEVEPLVEPPVPATAAVATAATVATAAVPTVALPMEPMEPVVADRDHTSSTASSSRTPQPQTPLPWTTWTPPLEVDEGPETQETADQDTLRARASSFEEDEPPEPSEPRHADVEEARESTSKIEALRERLLSEAKDLYEQAFRDCPDCSYAVNGLTLFVNQRSLKIELLERAIELDDENPYALANLGGELFGVDDHRALQLLEKALQINPRLFYARLCKSKVLLRLGNLPAAVEAARSQLEWQPHDEMAARFLSQLEFRLDVVRRRMLIV